ncbi:hypothetical protein ACNSOL_12140 (plasmid) [Aliarcobacter lanthieri]|uniref:hypothetical protein n=1 Tax=Aliarcobacter lanthieri TaxID=1355374 RepID=UPI003AAB243E
MKLITKTSMLIYIITFLILSYYIGSTYYEELPIYAPGITILVAKIGMGFLSAFLICSFIYLIYILLRKRKKDLEDG